MKKHRRQSVNVLGQKQLVDVPVDDELYKADNRDEYLRALSKAKHVSLDNAVLADVSADVAEVYEEAQLFECLREAVKALDKIERRLVKYIFFDELTEQQAAKALGISQPAVSKRLNRIFKKLRDSLTDWQ